MLTQHRRFARNAPIRTDVVRRLVLSLGMVLGGVTTAQAQAASKQGAWSLEGPPPAVGRIRLGQGVGELDSLLGPASTVQYLEAGRESRTYACCDLTIVADSGAGVVWIGLLGRRAGDVAGLRVGDSRERADQILGRPSLGRGETRIYVARDWRLGIQLDETVEFVYALVLGRPEFFPHSSLGLWATLERLAIDLFRAGDAVGLFAIISLTNFLLWRRYRYWVPRYVHALAALAFLVICWLNWLWLRVGGELTLRRVLMILTFPAIVYFFFIGAGGVKAALSRPVSPRPPGTSDPER